MHWLLYSTRGAAQLVQLPALGPLHVRQETSQARGSNVALNKKYLNWEKY